MTIAVNFRYRFPREDLDQEGTINFDVPGTRVTPKLAIYVVKELPEPI